MPRSASHFVIAVVIALAAAAPAQAVWEAPQKIDQTAEGFLGSGAGDVAVGDNGLATILFLQNDDDGTKLWATRRAAAATSWLAPPWRVTPAPTGAFSIEAAPDGATAGAYRVETEVDDDNPLTPEETVQSPHGLGWPADATGAAPKTADLGDQGDEGTPPVDADGRGFGWTAFIDGELNLQIVRFSLTNPATAPTTFEVAAVEPDPPGGNLNSTEARSNPRIDVNADGDVIVSFVEERMTAECCEPPGPSANAIWAVRKLQGQTAFTGPFRISQTAEEEPVDEHDPAIVPNGDATILFAADPAREGPNRVFARRWLATAGDTPPRPESSIEFVSSSAESAPDVSQIRAEAGPTPNVTAAWLQGAAQLNSSERTTAWTQVPQALSTAAGAYDIAVDLEGVATVVYREATTVKARRRAAGAQWAAPDTINSAPVAADTAPKVDAGAANQADAYFVQNDGTRRGAFATRFSGLPPVEPEAPPAPDTEGCPADVDLRFGTAGNDSIFGDDDRQTMLGGDGNDSLFGNGGDDCILGQNGDDAVHGGAGVDTLGGGDGNDRVTGGDGDETLMLGGAGNDSMNGDAGNDRVGGGDGDDTVDGSAGDDFLDGEAGNDKVRGGDGNDLLGGADGDDTVSGNGGANTLFGGLGNDTLLGGAEKDTMLGEDGDDVMSAGKGPDDVHGGSGNDKLRGGAGKNTLDGSLGDDGIRGGAQTDRLVGAEGLDTLFGLGGRDTLLGGAGKDKAYGGAGNDRLSGDAAGDNLRGGKGADRVSGGAGNDRLNGDGGKDRISGGGGNDRIGAADKKRDRITCGSGRDRVVADRVDRVSKSCERVRRRGRRR